MDAEWVLGMHVRYTSNYSFRTLDQRYVADLRHTLISVCKCYGG